MSTLRIAHVLLAFTTIVATAAQAQAGKTREQVQAELAQAIRDGDVIANGESGLTLRELRPDRYAARPASTLTREQVRAALDEARRTGDIVASGEVGLPLNQLHPQAYPPKVMLAGKTRAEVLAELREARRTGDIVADGESGQRLNELYPQRYANVAPTAAATMHAASSPSATLR